MLKPTVQGVRVFTKATCTACGALLVTVGFLSMAHPGKAQEALPSSSYRATNATYTGVWWESQAAHALDPTRVPISLSVEDLLFRVLQHSKQVKVFSDLPLIRETAVVEAQAAFDWTNFANTRWDDLSDPVGNALTAGPGINRFNDHNITFGFGARRRTTTGGQFEVSQQFGIRDNNSQFFVPNDQGSSRLVLNFTQPLLRGRGQQYNRSLICLAAIDQEVSQAELLRQLQDHLLQVTKAYWSLYLERISLLQMNQSYARAAKTVQQLDDRRGLDTSKIMVQSAFASFSDRKADLIRATAAVKNAEARILALVNDPEFSNLEALEFIPATLPTAYSSGEVNLQSAVQQAIQSRPEVMQEMNRIKAASVRCSMSKHELLPVLNLVTEAYVAGLDSNNDIAGSFGNQFSEGSPGYSVGLQYEVPFGNRAASARNTRRRLELRQVQNQYASVLENVRLDVRVAVRELDTSFKEMAAKRQAMSAQTAQLDAMEQRFQLLSGESDTAATALINLLDSQERLRLSEYEFLQAQVTYNLGLMNLRRAQGTLLMEESVVMSRGTECQLPTNYINKAVFTDAQPVQPELMPIPLTHH